MTYKELAEQITKMSEERQQDDVSISLDLSEEIIPALRIMAVLGDNSLSNTPVAQFRLTFELKGVKESS